MVTLFSAWRLKLESYSQGFMAEVGFGAGARKKEQVRWEVATARPPKPLDFAQAVP